MIDPLLLFVEVFKILALRKSSFLESTGESLRSAVHPISSRAQAENREIYFKFFIAVSLYKNGLTIEARLSAFDTLGVASVLVYVETILAFVVLVSVRVSPERET